MDTNPWIKLLKALIEFFESGTDEAKEDAKLYVTRSARYAGKMAGKPAKDPDESELEYYAQRVKGGLLKGFLLSVLAFIAASYTGISWLILLGFMALIAGVVYVFLITIPAGLLLEVIWFMAKRESIFVASFFIVLAVAAAYGFYMQLFGAYVPFSLAIMTLLFIIIVAIGNNFATFPPLLTNIVWIAAVVAIGIGLFNWLGSVATAPSTTESELISTAKSMQSQGRPVLAYYYARAGQDQGLAMEIWREDMRCAYDTGPLDAAFCEEARLSTLSELRDMAGLKADGKLETISHDLDTTRVLGRRTITLRRWYESRKFEVPIGEGVLSHTSRDCRGKVRVAYVYDKLIGGLEYQFRFLTEVKSGNPVRRSEILRLQLLGEPPCRVTIAKHPLVSKT